MRNSWRQRKRNKFIKKAMIGRRVREIIADSRKKLMTEGNFAAAAFGCIAFSAFIVLVGKVTDAFYGILNVSEITGIRTDDESKEYFEFVFLFMLTVPLVAGIKKYCMSLCDEGKSSKLKNGVSEIFSAYQVNDRMFLLYIFSAVKLLVPIIMLKLYFSLSVVCKYLAKNTVAAFLSLKYIDLSSAVRITESDVLRTASGYRIVFAFLCLAVFSFIMKKIFFAEEIILHGDANTFWAVLSLCICIARGAGDYIRSFRRRAFRLAVLSVVTFGAATLYAVPCCFLFKSELYFLCLRAYRDNTAEKASKSVEDEICKVELLPEIFEKERSDFS